MRRASAQIFSIGSHRKKHFSFGFRCGILSLVCRCFLKNSILYTEKLKIRIKYSFFHCRSPHGERGLKYPRQHRAGRRANVAPHTGSDKFVHRYVPWLPFDNHNTFTLGRLFSYAYFSTLCFQPTVKEQCSIAHICTYFTSIAAGTLTMFAFPAVFLEPVFKTLPSPVICTRWRRRHILFCKKCVCLPTSA